jgi:glutamyl-tRNA synthetase
LSHRLRFAPSPTGYLHVGGARTALFNWLFARRYGGVFLLRVEDTDKARSTDESTRAIFEGLQWLDLDWDEEVVYQGANLERHQRDARALLDAGTAYRCFCTPEELDERRQAAEARKETFRYDRLCDQLSADEVARRVAAGVPHTIRFRVSEGVTAWDDLVHGRIEFANRELDDFVILRSDGTPIYNMAVVSDDIAMGITLVMRGDDHISNTPKQILLYQALGAALPQFAHLPMIHDMEGKKLSKRRGAVAVGDYRSAGILPDAMANFLALLGWSPGGDREIMSRPELVELFSTDGLLKKASVFDTKKLEWMNGQHLNLAALETIAAIVQPAIVEAGLTTADDLTARPDWWLNLLGLLRVRARTINDIVRQARPYFLDDVEYDPDAVKKLWSDREKTRELLRGARERIASSAWDAAALEESLRSLAEAESVSAGKVLQALRVALTGVAASPGIFDVLLVIGRDRSLARIAAALQYLEKSDAR